MNNWNHPAQTFPSLWGQSEVTIVNKQKTEKMAISWLMEIRLDEGGN